MSHDAMNHGAFVTATSDAAWVSIDEIVQRLDEIAFWSEDFIESSLESRKKAWIRKEIKNVRGEDGWPLFASVVTMDPENQETTRIYKQERMFDRDDYAQVVRYHEDRSQYHHHMAAGWAERAADRFGMQLSLPHEQEVLS